MILFYNPYESGFNSGATRRVAFLMSGLKEQSIDCSFYNKDNLLESTILRKLVSIPVLNRLLYFIQILLFSLKGYSVVTEVILAPVFMRNVHLTIHDLKAFDTKAKRGRGKKFLYTFFARIARSIITVSDYTKSQLVELCGVSESKITVIYNGIRKVNLDLLANINTQKEYDFVYVSSFAKHKRHKQLIEALPDSSSLLLIGQDFGELGSVESTVTQLGSNVTILTNVESDEALYRSIKSAKIGVFPSVYEGFGIPVLEYFAADLFIVTSDIAPFKELGRFINLQHAADDQESLCCSLQDSLANYESKSPNEIEKLDIFNELSLSKSLCDLVERSKRLQL